MYEMSQQELDRNVDRFKARLRAAERLTGVNLVLCSLVGWLVLLLALYAFLGWRPWHYQNAFGEAINFVRDPRLCCQIHRSHSSRVRPKR